MTVIGPNGRSAGEVDIRRVFTQAYKRLDPELAANAKAEDSVFLMMHAISVAKLHSLLHEPTPGGVDVSDATQRYPRADMLLHVVLKKLKLVWRR